MRHKDNSNNPSPEKPAQRSGLVAANQQDIPEQDSPTRLPIKVGPPEASWSHAKWLALADQALLD